MLEIVNNPFVRKRSIDGTLLDAWACNMGDCKRVECSYDKIVLHIAVEHGVRPIKLDDKLKDNKQT